MVKRGLSSVQRTVRACREQGRFVEKVEQWISYGSRNAQPTPGKPMGTRRDAFGFIDIIAIDTDAIVAIQACTSGRKEHYDMIIANEYALPWLKAGGRIELWSFSKRVKYKGCKVKIWIPKVEEITLDDFSKVIVSQKVSKVPFGKVKKQPTSLFTGGSTDISSAPLLVKDVEPKKLSVSNGQT